MTSGTDTLCDACRTLIAMWLRELADEFDADAYISPASLAMNCTEDGAMEWVLGVPNG